MIFLSEGFAGQVVIYYTGSVDYGFGGNSSRPKYSFIRIYNERFKQGLGVAKFGFKAGTIVDIKWIDNALVVTSDPSRPLATNQKVMARRIWKIKLP